MKLTKIKRIKGKLKSTISGGGTRRHVATAPRVTVVAGVDVTVVGDIERTRQRERDVTDQTGELSPKD